MLILSSCTEIKLQFFFNVWISVPVYYNSHRSDSLTWPWHNARTLCSHLWFTHLVDAQSVEMFIKCNLFLLKSESRTWDHHSTHKFFFWMTWVKASCMRGFLLLLTQLTCLVTSTFLWKLSYRKRFIEPLENEFQHKRGQICNYTYILFYFPVVKCGIYAYFYFFFLLRRSRHKGWYISAKRISGGLLCHLKRSAYCKFNGTSWI